MNKKTNILMLVGIALWSALALGDDHTTRGTAPAATGAHAQTDRAASVRLLEILKDPKATIETDHSYFFHDELFEPSTKDVKKITLDDAKRTKLVKAIEKIQTYLDEMKKRCIDGKPKNVSAQFLYRYVNGFLQSLARGISSNDGPKLRLRANELSEFCGGLVKYFDLKEKTYPQDLGAFVSQDDGLRAASRELVQVLGGSDDMDGDYREDPLKTAIDELVNKEPVCVAGAITPDTTPPVVDAANIKFDSTRKNAKGQPLYDSGEEVQISIPVHDDGIGLARDTYAGLYFDPDKGGNTFYLSGTYNAKTGRIEAKMKLNEFSPSTTYTLRTVSIQDRAGNSANYEKNEKSPAFEVIGKNEDKTPPTVDYAHTATDLPEPKKGELPKASAGQLVKISIPVTDDKSGIEDGAYASAYLGYTDPTGKRQTFQVTGRYNQSSGKVVIDWNVNKWAHPGVYDLDHLSSLNDRANNTIASDRIEPSPLRIQIESKNPDTTPPKLELDKVTFSATSPKPGEPPALAAGQTLEVVIPVSDENSGLEEGAYGSLSFLGPNNTSISSSNARYDEKRKAFVARIETRVAHTPGEYHLYYIYSLADRAGNSVEVQSQPHIKFNLLPPN